MLTRQEMDIRIIKIIKEHHTVQNKPDRGRKRTERKLMKDASKDRTAKTPLNDLAKSGIVVSKKTITRKLYRNELQC